jgi:two-component system, LytTR family, response regulator
MESKYRAVIIDDELLAIENLTLLLNRFCPQVEIVATASRADEALAAINSKKPDVVFLDMHLPDMKGFDIVDMAFLSEFKIIVISAHQEYAMEGIKHQVLDYLLKPIDPRELVESVKKLPPIQQRHGDQIMVNDAQHVYIVKHSDILYIKADRSQTDIVRRNDKKISCISRPLSSYEMVLPPRKFYRCHNSYLINLDEAKVYVKGDSTVVLSNEEHISVSREKKEGLWEAIQNNTSE